MRTTYYHFIDGSVGIGTTYHTSNGTINEFGIGISSHIGIGTVNNVYAPFAIHHDGPASESNRTGGIEIVGNSNASGDKHGARILAYNRVFYDQSDPPVAIKGFRRLRFQASEYQFETPSDNGTSTNNADPTFNITGFGSVGIGTTNPTQILHLSSNSNQTSIRLSNVGTGGTDWYVQSSGNDASNGQGNFSIYNGAINDYALSITAEGNVGIGTTNPQGKLHISSGTSGDCELIIEADTDNNNENDNPRILFRQDGGSDHSAIENINNELILSNSVSGGGIVFETGTSSPYTNATEKLRITPNGSVLPGSDNTQNLGSGSKRWANVYTGDMHLSNMNTGGNEVDGSEGHWTLQEGSDDLFLINRNTGKKYKLNLTEVS